MRNVIVEGAFHGCSFVRLYLLDRQHVADLIEHANRGYDYIFAYSIVDLGASRDSRERRSSAKSLALTPEDVLFGRLHKTSRKKIRRTYRDQSINIVDDPSRDESYEFYCRTKQAEGVKPDFVEDFSSFAGLMPDHRYELVSSTSWYYNDNVLREALLGSVCAGHKTRGGVRRPR